MGHSDWSIVLEGQLGSSLPLPTKAVLRGLQLLVTHLSLSEIAERQFLSRATVKTQTISSCHKLGVSSRSEAVGGAADSELIESAAVSTTRDFNLYPDDVDRRLAR
jgi:hypothetical protein